MSFKKILKIYGCPFSFKVFSGAFCLATFCLVPLPCKAVEIKRVMRDFDYPNIFIYKYQLIGISQVNKFSFEGEPTENNRPDFFLVTLKSNKSERGKLVDVLFEFKTQKSKEIKTLQKKVILNKTHQKIRFQFENYPIHIHGRVELWNVKVKMEGQILAEQQSQSVPFHLLPRVPPQAGGVSESGDRRSEERGVTERN